MKKEKEFLKRKEAIAYMGLQVRVFNSLVQCGKLNAHNRNGTESYKRADLVVLRARIGRSSQSDGTDWLTGFLDGLSGVDLTHPF